MFVELTLSHLKLRCVVVLAFSKQTGLTLLFKDDPLESLTVSSSFDSISVLHQFIQTVRMRSIFLICWDLQADYEQEIEHQLRERFRRDLPSLIHRLSQRWLADMGQHPPTLPPIVVEREPDDSFHSINISPSPPSSPDIAVLPGSSSDSEPSESLMEEENLKQGAEDKEEEEGDAIALKASEQLSRPPSPILPSLPTPRRAGLRSSVLHSLQRTNSTFATTFSKPPSTPQNASEIPADFAAISLGVDSKPARKRLHRLDSASPNTSPQKPSHKNTQEKETARMAIRRAELDEYFPVSSMSAGRDSMQMRMSSRVEFGEEGNKPRNFMANKPSLRRSMMSNRLREANYFAPSYPP